LLFGTLPGVAYNRANHLRTPPKLLRVAVGMLVATLVGYLLHDPVEQVLTPGQLGATTRGLDTIIGCLLAFAAYFFAPTWQRRLLTERLADWAGATARQIDALVLFWAADEDRDRTTVAHAVVRARLSALEFIEAARSARFEPRDRHGRWQNDALDAVIDAVTSVRRQLAVLSALAPLWSAEESAAVIAAVKGISRNLKAVGLKPVNGSPAGDAGVTDDETSSPDTAAALERLHDALTALETVAAAQTPPVRGNLTPPWPPLQLATTHL
jgi:uncharacterized membrane protein YccC